MRFIAIKYLSILHMAKNILRKQFGNMYGKNNPYDIEDTPKPNPSLPPIESPTFTMKGIILFTILVFLLLFLYLNREKVLTHLKQIYAVFKPGDTVDQLEEKYNEIIKNSKLLDDISNTEKKIMGRLDKLEQNKPQSNLDEIKRKLDKLEAKSSVQDSQNKVTIKDKLCTIEEKEKNRIETEKKDKEGGVKQIDEHLYRKDQIANYNGFCYIGYDNKRECTNVYEGDICMSGQIFPTMEVCMNPNKTIQMDE